MAVTLGISWFGALASLTPYRPYFLGLALVALGWAYVTTYRARWRQLRRSNLRGYRPTAPEVVLWATTLVVGLLVLFPHYNPFL
ncbi:MAG: mercuric transporter MerT family protein [Candidatus Rokuibacteriota bacterium]